MGPPWLCWDIVTLSCYPPQCMSLTLVYITHPYSHLTTIPKPYERGYAIPGITHTAVKAKRQMVNPEAYSGEG